MKSVLISIQPKWVEKIASGEKTIEVRKTAPKEEPFKAYIYCTKAKSQWRFSNYEGAYENSAGEIVYVQRHIIGEFVCDKVYSIKNRGFCFSVATEGESITNEIARQSCLDYDDMVNYLGDKDGYGWHISDLKIYDKPKRLSEFNRPCPSTNQNCEPCIRYGKPYTLEFDEEAWKIFCSRRVTRPPQSWQYVEELENG